MITEPFLDTHSQSIMELSLSRYSVEKGSKNAVCREV